MWSERVRRKNIVKQVSCDPIGDFRFEYQKLWYIFMALQWQRTKIMKMNKFYCRSFHFHIFFFFFCTAALVVSEEKKVRKKFMIRKNILIEEGWACTLLILMRHFFILLFSCFNCDVHGSGSGSRKKSHSLHCNWIRCIFNKSEMRTHIKWNIRFMHRRIFNKIYKTPYNVPSASCCFITNLIQYSLSFSLHWCDKFLSHI